MVPNQHVADVAGDGAGNGFDIGPAERCVRVACGRFGTGAHPEPALAFALVEEGEAVEVGGGPGPPLPRGQVADVHREVVEIAQGRLVLR